MRFLIDECLSPALVPLAQHCGHEAHHLTHIGRAGAGDSEILALALNRDMVLVTNNANDFRRLYAAQELHPGLVILVPNVERQMQLRLFRAALTRLSDIGDAVNKALEVDIRGVNVVFEEYELPR